MKKQHILLSEADKTILKDILSKGVLPVRVHKRVMALKYLDAGKSYIEVSELLDVCYPTLLDWAKKYQEEGLKMLKDKQRSGRPKVFDGEQCAKITALACSTAPEGYARWSLRLLADRVVELGIVESVSYSEVRLVLKKMNFSHISSDNGALGS